MDFAADFQTQTESDMPRNKTLCCVNAAMIVAMSLYWTLVLVGVIPIHEIVPGFRNWTMAFVPANVVIVGSLALSLASDVRCRVFFSIVSGGCLVYLGAYGLSYSFVAGLIYTMDFNEFTEVARKLVFISVGLGNLFVSWKMLPVIARVTRAV